MDITFVIIFAYNIDSLFCSLLLFFSTFPLIFFNSLKMPFYSILPWNGSYRICFENTAEWFSLQKSIAMIHYQFIIDSKKKQI